MSLNNSENELKSMHDDVLLYQKELNEQFCLVDCKFLMEIELAVLKTMRGRNRLFICGNGGSAANANHIANDLLYGVSKKLGQGSNCTSLCANESINFCLANDEGFENVFTYQLAASASAGDYLLVLSGSGNSENIVRALELAKKKRLLTFAILGFEGGRSKNLADFVLHFPCNNMQVCEDLQMSMMHIVSRRILAKHNHQ